MSDEGGLVAGRYRIVRRIGAGAMGTVWQAHDEVLARTVAVKQLLLQPGLDPHEAEDAKQRTMREGRIAARLHHPNAITVFDVITDDNGQPCLVMEYLPSTSLAEVLREQSTLPPAEVARIGAQVASALKEAHAVGIVHRDIKPGNVLLADNGLVKITDFGISRAKDDVTVTRTGMIAGTPAYLAPEVAIGADPGPESDIFSLGSTLYAACEGQPPFGLSENTLGLLHAVAAGKINPPRRSGPMTSVLAALLHPEAEQRPTAAEAEEMLNAVAHGESPFGGPEDPTRHAAGAGGAIAGAAAARAMPGETAVAGHGTNRTAALYDNYDAPNSGYGYNDPGNGYGYNDRNGGYGYNDPNNGYGYNEPGSGYGRTAVANDSAVTRAVPDAHVDQLAEPDEDERRSKWKAPAIAAGVAAAGLVGLVIWLFSPTGKQNDPAAPSKNPAAVPPPISSSSLVETTDSPTVESTAGNNNSHKNHGGASSIQSTHRSTTTTQSSDKEEESTTSSSSKRHTTTRSTTKSSATSSAERAPATQ